MWFSIRILTLIDLPYCASWRNESAVRVTSQAAAAPPPVLARSVGAPQAAARSIHPLMILIDSARFAASGSDRFSEPSICRLMIRDLTASAAALICLQYSSD